ncbi:MAG: hypothetical protein K0U84_00675 [Actinomycetia bacterium]|nr:hypothetical protein [Actinomycetes bacterium]
MGDEDVDEVSHRIMAERQSAFVFDPVTTQEADGTWLSRYPGADWSVTGDTCEDAETRLYAEELVRMRDPETARWKSHAIVAYVENGPIAGVYEISLEDNERIMAAPDPNAALKDMIAELDRQRGPLPS